MPDRVKSFGEIDSREDRPRARARFVKPIVKPIVKPHPKWTEQGTEFDLELIVQSENRSGGERECN